ncbi:MAG: substrate-binding domain-containing protein, partial [Lachnospiraceae bacterium]|nr:substrate-binding domain-containing protein [Lachnospiraceae bacterium]
ALNELKNEGIVERFPNKGTFVSESTAFTAPIEENSFYEQTDTTETLLPEIACIIPSIQDLFSLSMVNGVLSAFPENEYICHIFQSRNPQIENYLLKRCLETNITGIVLFPQDQPFFSNELLFMKLQKYPLVLLDRYLPRLDTSYVIADNRSAGSLCLQHLHQLGHQRFAFLTSSERHTFSIKYRLDGIYSTAEQLNIPESSIYLIEHFMYMDKSNKYDDLLVKLVKEEKITGFITAESGLCAYLYERFHDLKISVPGTVSLVSFDKPTTDQKCSDFFTHINQSEYLMGQEAGKILRNRIEQNDMNIYHRIVAPKLEVHHSTGSIVL